MKILFATHRFYPEVGGLETVSLILAEQFAAAGHEVRLVTHAVADAETDDLQFDYPIFRQPGPGRMLELLGWCDVYFQNNISVRTLWPLLLRRRPWVPAHHTWLTRVDGSVGWQDRLKKRLLRHGTPIAVSHEVAQSLEVPGTVVIGNPYKPALFRLLPNVPRTRDLVFLARLVSDKGGDLLLDALADLKRHGFKPDLTVVGDGPEMGNLRRQTVRLGLEAQVEFRGVLQGEALVETLNQHRVMVVPSRTPEPFGVVALEGIACGCVVVGSEGGGLTDAIGRCGLTFPNHDRDALAGSLGRVLFDPHLYDELRAEAPAHLGRHQPGKVAEAYLDVFRGALGRRKGKPGRPQAAASATQALR